MRPNLATGKKTDFRLWKQAAKISDQVVTCPPSRSHTSAKSANLVILGKVVNDIKTADCPAEKPKPVNTEPYRTMRAVQSKSGNAGRLARYVRRQPVQPGRCRAESTSDKFQLHLAEVVRVDQACVGILSGGIGSFNRFFGEQTVEDCDRARPRGDKTAASGCRYCRSSRMPSSSERSHGADKFVL